LLLQLIRGKTVVRTLHQLVPSQLLIVLLLEKELLLLPPHPHFALLLLEGLLFVSVTMVGDIPKHHDPSCCAFFSSNGEINFNNWLFTGQPPAKCARRLCLGSRHW
jgi:hypothetical protein